MTALQTAIAAVLTAFKGLKAGDKITPEGHEAMFVFNNTHIPDVDHYRDDCSCVSCVRGRLQEAECNRLFYHLISPELAEAIEELEKAKDQTTEQVDHDQNKTVNKRKYELGKVKKPFRVMIRPQGNGPENFNKKEPRDIDGFPLWFAMLPDVEFFLHKTHCLLGEEPDFRWSITEVTTGLRVGPDPTGIYDEEVRTKVETIEATLDRLIAAGVEKVLDVLKKSDKLPRKGRRKKE